jgi:sulfofructose kinase
VATGEPYVVCVGLATLDTIVALPRHPQGDDRVVASEIVVAGGGPAATAAVALVRLGVRAFFVGSVGDDERGEVIRAGLEREGVDVSELSTVAGRRSPQSIVLVSDAGRAICAHPGDVPVPRPSARARELCAGAAWVHADHVGYTAVRGLGRVSLDAGNAVHGLDLREVALYAPTESALREAFGGPEQALRAGAELVVVTRGADGSAAYAAGGEVVEAPGVATENVSTLGAGDVFHGALLARLVQGAALADALAFANECAALSCRALDGRSAIPTAAELAA